MSNSNDVEVEQPPSYEDCNRGEAPPPYHSLFEQMKDMKKNSSNSFQFCTNVGSLLLNTFVMTIFMALVLAIPISMIVIGAMFKDDCPVERLIPIYLIVMGAVLIPKGLLDLKLRYQRNRLPPEEREEFRGSVPEVAVINLLNCFIFSFFIAGNVWIYQNYSPDMSNPAQSDYCHPSLYLFAFWLTTTTYILLALLCCCLCSVMCFWGLI